MKNKIKNTLIAGALSLATLYGADAYSKPLCEDTPDNGKICRLIEPDRKLTFQTGKLEEGSKFCEVKVEYKDGRHISYDSILCKDKVTSYVKGKYNDTKQTRAVSRDGLEDHFTKDIDPEFNQLVQLILKR